MAQNGKGFGKICVAKRRIPPSGALPSSHWMKRMALCLYFLNHNVFRCGYNAHMQSACMAANHGIAAAVHPLRYGAGEKQKGYAKSRPAILRAAWAICIRVPVKALILSRVAHREMLLYPCPAALLLPPHFLPVPFCICS